MYWVFDKKTKAGDVSDLKNVDNKYYFVVAVKNVRPEGYASVADVTPQIQAILTAQKSVERKLEEVRSQIAGETSLEAIAEKLGTTVSHASGLSFGSLQYSQNDPAFLGAVAVAEPGKIYSVGGTVGVYVFEVTDRTVGSFFTDADAETQLQRKAAYHTNMVQSVIANEADIKDNRARFF